MKTHENQTVNEITSTCDDRSSEWEQSAELRFFSQTRNREREITFAKQLVDLALKNKSRDPVLLEVARLTSYADYILILTASSQRHARALSIFLGRTAREQGRHLLGTEGDEDGQWILLDFGEVIVHVFLEQAREFYDLDGRWVDAKRLPLEPS